MSSDSELSLDQLIELERRAAEREAAEAAAAERPPSDDDDVLVLPWWQRPFNIGVLVVTAALLAGMIGWLIGDSGAQPEHNDVDVGFLQDMREHHEQAVLMALIYHELEGTDPAVETVARTILRGQSVEVGRMIQLLRSFGADEARMDGAPMDWMDMGEGGGDGHLHGGGGDGDHTEWGNPDDPFTQMPGMATEEQLDALEAASGAEADALFIELMIVHHQAGVEMAAYAAEHAANDEVVAFAKSMVAGQQAEIHEMEALLP